MKKRTLLLGFGILLALFMSNGIVSAQNNGGAIQFGQGETSAWINGNLAANGSIQYSFYAMAGQIVSVSVTSTNSNAVLGLSEDDDWYSIITPDRKYMYYTFPLNKTGTFYLTIKDTGAGGNFKVVLSIPPLTPTYTRPVNSSGQPGGTIQFSTGQSTAWVTGWVNSNSSVTYEFYAAKNQILSLALKSTSGSAVMGLKDSKNYVYLAPEKQWSYYISPLYDGSPFYLTIYNSGTATDFTIQMTIPPLEKPMIPTPNPSQPSGGAIQFGMGETSAALIGNVPAYNCVRYTLYGGSDYTMITLLNSATGTAVLGISDLSGTVYLSPANNYTYWLMPLSTTTTYYLDVCNNGPQATDFSLSVVIPARITVDQYTRSAFKEGSLKSNGVVSYSIDGTAGQTLTVSLTAGATPQAFLRITGMGDGVVYLDNNTFQTYWSGSLPVSQSYLIDIVAYGVASSYQMMLNLR